MTPTTFTLLSRDGISVTVNLEKFSTVSPVFYNVLTEAGMCTGRTSFPVAEMAVELLLMQDALNGTVDFELDDIDTLLALSEKYEIVSLREAMWLQLWCVFL